jgi:hypothetical protein
MKPTAILGVVIGVALQGAMLFAQNPSGNPGKDQQKHREMMPVHEKMIEEQKAQDAEIDKLLAEMNAAVGEKRIDAIMAVLNKLVEQRKTMNAEIAAHFDK